MTPAPVAAPALVSAMRRNVALYPWFKFFQNLIFWQAVWFLFFQSRLSGAEAVLLYAIYDVSTTAMEVPSGYMSDRLGRRVTVIMACFAGIIGAGLLIFGGGFWVFAAAQLAFGASAAFASGTDSALLYESLVLADRAEEIEAQETRAWQFSLSALALSAFLGGVMAQGSDVLAFAAAGCAMAVAGAIAWRFVEPTGAPRQQATGADYLQMMRVAFAQPVLVWLFALSVLMYGFSHLPFVFGQPFIAQAIEAAGWQAGVPVVSGSVSSMMMLVSVAASLCALWMRRRLGLGRLLMLAFGIQLLIISVLALTNAALAIVVLFLRMVPDSWSRPFIIARMQPLLSDAGRATYLSVQSFAGRLLFAASLFFASGVADTGGEMVYSEIRQVLGYYVAAGAACFAVLGIALWWRRVPLDG